MLAARENVITLLVEKKIRGEEGIFQRVGVGKSEKLELLHKKLCVMKVQDYPIKDITSFRS